jgi:chemotaxis protein CheC
LNEETFPLTKHQIEQLAIAFHRGALESSEALGRWLATPTSISIDSVDQCALENATNVLGESDETVCMCVMQMRGTLTGQMLLAFDDASGLAITDRLLSQAPGTAAEWRDVEVSAALETMNISGSAYLNGIARDLSERGKTDVQLIPGPPVFLRDYAECLLQTAFLDQAIAGSQVVFARARYEVLGNPLRWSFLLIPDPDSLKRLTEILAGLH